MHFAESTFLLASLLLEQGNMAEACPLANAASERMSAIYGLQSWRPAAAQTLVGACEYHNGQQAAALEMVNEAVQRLESVVPPGNIYLSAATQLAASLD